VEWKLFLEFLGKNSSRFKVLLIEMLLTKVLPPILTFLIIHPENLLKNHEK